jgi:RNA-directed DNA polymerase
VQACLVLVLAPILEADFTPVSDGFRPRRRAHDAIAEIHPFGTKGYQWVLDADVEACFDNIAHSTVLERMRRRIADKRVLALSQAFVKAGIMSADGKTRDTNTGTPQGGIASPLLANIALSALDEHFCAKWDAHDSRQPAAGGRPTAHRRRGGATSRIVGYADLCRARHRSVSLERSG